MLKQLCVVKQLCVEFSLSLSKYIYIYKIFLVIVSPKMMEAAQTQLSVEYILPSCKLSVRCGVYPPFVDLNFSELESFVFHIYANAYPRKTGR